MEAHINRKTLLANTKKHIQSLSFQEESDIILGCYLALILSISDLEEVIAPFQKCTKVLDTFSYEVQEALAIVFMQLDKAPYLPDWQAYDLIPYIEWTWLKTHLTLCPKEAINYPNKHLLAKAITDSYLNERPKLSTILEASLNDPNYAIQFANLDLGITKQ